MPTKDKRELDQLRREARKIAESLPEPLRKPWLAIAFRADVHTHIVSGKTRETIVKYGRQYAESATSRSALYRAIPELEKLGLIKKVSQKTGDRNEKNVYHLNFDAMLDGEPEDPEWQAWQDDIAAKAEAFEVADHYEPEEPIEGEPPKAVHEPRHSRLDKRLPEVVAEHYEPEEPIDEDPELAKIQKMQAEHMAKIESYQASWLQFDGFTVTV